jgi:RHS repeat-associated protein
MSSPNIQIQIQKGFATQTSDGIFANSYTYDTDGYLKSKTDQTGTTTYTYGTLGELKTVSLSNGTTISYAYNANNQRVSKSVNNQITEKYLWLNLTTLLAVYDGNNNLKQRFVYADSRTPVAYTDNSNNIYYLSYNHIGTLKAVTNTNGQILKQLEYDSFGNILSDTNPTLDIHIGFAGGLYDKDTQLTRFGHRDYDSYTGRWTAKDPIDFEGGDSNLYGYVLGDPINFVDPSGLDLNSTQVIDLWKGINDWSSSNVPYVPTGRTKSGADCSGAVQGIYGQSGMPLCKRKMGSWDYPENKCLKKVEDNPRFGDIGYYDYGHVVIYGGAINKNGKRRNVYSTLNKGVYGRADTSWFGDGQPTWYRYNLPEGGNCGCE